MWGLYYNINMLEQHRFINMQPLWTFTPHLLLLAYNKRLRQFGQKKLPKDFIFKEILDV